MILLFSRRNWRVLAHSSHRRWLAGTPSPSPRLLVGIPQAVPNDGFRDPVGASDLALLHPLVRAVCVAGHHLPIVLVGTPAELDVQDAISDVPVTQRSFYGQGCAR